MNLRVLPQLREYIENVIHSQDRIPVFRKEILRDIAAYIRTKAENKEVAKLNFICTHNSRRSHLSSVWAAIAAYHFGLEGIETYSGGTEATAFNPRAVAALQRAGIAIENTGEDNPVYFLHFAANQEPLTCFSKTFDHPANPDKGFAAIMTCSDADENCPFVPGTEYRASLTYNDPKASDGTPEEEKVYDERCFQIAVEMFYLMKQVHLKQTK